MKKLVFFALFLTFVYACCGDKTAGVPELFPKEAFDKVLDGKQISIYTLRNDNGMAVQLTNYGARMVSVWVPSADGEFRDVIMGFESIEGYLSANDQNSGPVVGRYGNRIGKGKFTLDGKEYTLQVNNGENHLHGGDTGFAFQVWDAAETKTASGDPAVVMKYRAKDGEGGYPGNLDIEVEFSLTAKNEFFVKYKAVADAPTVLNPTIHPYFNLHGTTSASTNSHYMTIYADYYTPTDAGLIPTGEIASVGGTPLDFRKATAIGERIESDFQDIVYGLGYDHNFVLNKKGTAGKTELAAEVYEPSTGIVLKVLTDQPGMQFYSGNFMDGTDTGKYGNVNYYRTGIALETQNFPDAPNHGNFPSSVLRPGETYTHTCVYAFGVRE